MKVGFWTLLALCIVSVVIASITELDIFVYFAWYCYGAAGVYFLEDRAGSRAKRGNGTT